MDPIVSIIVPVYNQWDLIPCLVECIERQTVPEHYFELLLIDNGSANVPVLDDEPGFVRHLSCLVPGSYAARNHGVAHARGKLLAFTDADCRPHRDWLREMTGSPGREALERTIIAGTVTIVPRNGGCRSAAELYDTVMGIPQALYVRRGYGVTANLMVPATMLDRLGGFDERRFSGGDAEFCRRATAAGFTLRYCPSVIVEHPARHEMQTLITKVRRIKGGQLSAGPLRRRALYTIRTFLPPVRAWFRALKASGYSLGQRSVVCAVQARLWMAEMGEVLRLLLGKKPERI